MAESKDESVDILQERLASVRALADQWERLAREGSKTYSEIRRRHAADLRAALRTPPGATT